MNHWYFTGQSVADRQQALTEQADSHRLLNPRVAPPTRRRRFALRLRLARRAPEPVQTFVAIPSTAPNPSSPEKAPDIAAHVGLPAHSR